MRLITVILCILPATFYAQSKADYEKAISRFMKFYNSNQSDSICAMFPNDVWYKTNCLWTPNLLASSREDYGTMKSFKYLGKDKTDPERVTVFKVVFEKEIFAMSLTLHKDDKLGTFRFKTLSDEIEKMMAKN